MKLDNFIVYQLDEKNFTYDEYREVVSKTGEKSMKWTRCGGYYGSVEAALNSLKKYIVGKYIEYDNAERVLRMIERLNGAIVNCQLKIQPVDSETN